ncbi:MAG TPA: hypothetical protein VHY10_15820 [Xanthobacteraceae bacterium]|jgi:hypothetical protein|nr:hypothetical protein [Xanthobacteraceae bacterium]
MAFHRHCKVRSEEAIQLPRSGLDCVAALAMTGLALALVAATASHAVAQGYPGYPDTIMVPEGAASRHHAARDTVRIAPPAHAHPSLRGHELFVGKLHRPPGVFVATRGSSGSVLPTPLPRTTLIPPEGSGRLTLPPVAQEQGPSIVPGVRNPVPNLPHGPETFQDRASRCAFQSGLYNVPGTARSRYMGGCVQ